MKPKTEGEWLALRGRDITASTVAALFGEHEFTTPYQLWAEKTGKLPFDGGSAGVFKRGRRIEGAVVEELVELYPKWKFEYSAASNTYYRAADARLGCTPDVLALHPERGLGAVQVKTADQYVFRKKWFNEDGSIEPPFWIAMQVALEAYMTGASWGAVAVLPWGGAGFDVQLVEVPLIEGVFDAMAAKAAEFWALVEAGEAPDIDFTRDGQVLDTVYRHGDAFHEIDLISDADVPRLIAERNQAVEDIKEATQRRDRIDAVVKAKLGTAEVAHIGRGKTISWKTQRKPGFFTEARSYRALNYPKEI